MAVIATSAPREDFIVQINGEYGIPFDERTLTAAAVSGQVILLGAGEAQGFGIVAKAGAIGDKVRVMVRGNPTSVNARALVGYVQATHKAAFETQGIIVVNE